MPETTEARLVSLQPPIEGVSVIIPCKNEELAVKMTVSEVREACEQSGLDYEIIVVDDGSDDRTGQLALEAGATVLAHNINLGYGNAIMNGIEKARYDIIAITDADGTYPASMLPRMLKEAARYDMVIGSRNWCNGNTSRTGMLLRNLLYYIILYFTGARAADYNSGLRVFHKHNLLEYRPIICPTFSFTTSITLIYLLTSRTVHFIPIEYSKRIGNSKVCYVRDALRTFSYVFIIVSMFMPYRLSLFLIFLTMLSNVLIWGLAGLFGLGAATQAGLHMTTCAAMLIVALTMVANPASHSYLKGLQGNWRRVQ